MERLVTSDFKLGVIAGGQLGKMLALAASNWDIKTYVLDADPHCPASGCCARLVRGSLADFNDVYNFGNLVDMVTLEIESVNAEALKRLKEEGKRVNPDPEVLEIIQDKGLQKQFYQRHGIPSSPFRLFDGKKEVLEALSAGALRFPFVQKLRRGGYDGRGVAVLRSSDDLNLLLDGPSLVEDLVAVQKEISVIVARNGLGETKCFPAVEMEFNDMANLVEKIICPAALEDPVQTEAVDLATRLIMSLDLCGLLAVEMFVLADGRVLVNEVAPRPHNSGHHTIESVVTSQYEQLLRALFDMPLGSTKIKMPAVMINLLGEPGFQGPVKYQGLSECLALEGVKIHLYGKKVTKPFRKMGHVTVLGETIGEATAKADIVKQKLRVVSW